MPSSLKANGNGDSHSISMAEEEDNRREDEAAQDYSAQDSLLPTTATTAQKRKKTKVRHGRGPIIDDDDQDEGEGDTVTEDGDSDTVTGLGGGPHSTTTDIDPELAAVSPDKDSDRTKRGRRCGSRKSACRSLTSFCCLAFGVVFLLVLLVVAIIHLWVGHLLAEEQRRHAGQSPETIARQGFLFEGPSAVRVVPTNSDSKAGQDVGVTIEVEAMMGMDVRKALGWEDKDAGKDVGRFAAWRQKTEARLVRWFVARADSVEISLDTLRLYADPAEPTLDVPNRDELLPPLIAMDDSLSFAVPLSYPSLADGASDARLDHFTLRIPLSFPAPHDLVEFGKRVYEEKRYRVRAEIASVEGHLTGGRGRKDGKKEKGWLLRRMMDKVTSVKGGMEDIVQVVEGKLPDMPAPPRDPADMVDLKSLSVFESPYPTLLSDSPADSTIKKPKRPSVSTEPETVIAFALSAVLKNPLLDAVKEGRIPPVAWSMPFRLPIEIALPLPPVPPVASIDGANEQINEEPQIALARVSIAPFGFGEQDKEAEVWVTGYVVPAGNLTPSNPPSPPTRDPSETSSSSNVDSSKPRVTAPQAPLSRALSRFVARYLSGRPNDVFLRYDFSGETKDGESMPPVTIPSDPARDSPLPPRFVSDLVRDQTFQVSVPGTNETPELFKDLRMEDMKVKLGGRGEGDDADLLASGRVVGEVVLPEMAASLAKGIDAKWIWPDVLVYDGELPRVVAAADDEGIDSMPARDQMVLGQVTPSAHGDQDSTQYPPSPIPANAFARMRPSSSMDAETIHIPGNATHPARTFVSASFVDAPLYLLPERGSVLRSFIGKILFGGKARASMKGLTSVRLGLSGFGEVELVEIPIEASFMVTRGGVQNPPSLAELVGLA